MLVVGAGPVGLTLAVLLGLRGRRVHVVERRSHPFPLPRAVHLDHNGARILDAAGVMAALAPRTEVMDAYEWRSAAGKTLLRLDSGGEPGRSGWPESSMFAQPDLDELLASRAAALPSVTVERGRALDALPDGPWVVGCDGAASTVRRLAAIPLVELGEGSEWLVVDVVPAVDRRWAPLNVQVCDPARPTTAVSGGAGRRRFEFMVLPGEDPEGLAARVWQLLAPWGLGPADAWIERSANYRFGAAVVERWRQDRVLLAGDAAHQMPPFAGQGLCSGLRDAANLAWKLDLVLTGLAGEELVDTYGSERAPQVRTEIDFSVELGRVICVADTAEAARRDATMAAAAGAGSVRPPPPPPLGPGLFLDGDPAAGHLAVQGSVERGGRPAGFDGAVGRGWVLLGRDGDPGADLDPPTRAGFDAIGGIATAAAGPEHSRWFADTGAAVILVRPDFAVFGTATTPTGGPALVMAALGALRRGGTDR